MATTALQCFSLSQASSILVQIISGNKTWGFFSFVNLDHGCCSLYFYLFLRSQPLNTIFDELMYPTTLAALILIILFSKHWSSPKKNSTTKVSDGKYSILKNIPFVEIKISKSINYSTNKCCSSQGTTTSTGLMFLVRLETENKKSVGFGVFNCQLSKKNNQQKLLISMLHWTLEYLTKNIKQCLNCFTFITIYSQIWLNLMDDHLSNMTKKLGIL
jgi:hypothetical protein